jgi:hypothetical protein
MAKIKIERSNRQAAQYQSTPTSAVALPVFQIQNQVDAGFSAIGNSIKRVAEKTKAVEDRNNIHDLSIEALPIITENYDKYNSSTNVADSLTFLQSLDIKNFDSLLKDQNKEVKDGFKTFLQKQQLQLFPKLKNEITARHVIKSKSTDEDILNDAIKKMADPDGQTKFIGNQEFNSFFADPKVQVRYGDKELKDKRKKANEKAFELQLINNARSGNIDLLNDNVRKEILSKVNPNRAKGILEALRNADTSFVVKQEQDIIFREKQNRDQKIANFSDLLVSLNNHRLNPTSETNANLPSLDDIYDARQSGAISNSQYETLLRFYSDGGTTLSDPVIEDIINSQFALANTFEKIDALQESVNIDPNISANLSVDSIIRTNGLVKKYKENRTFAREHRDFLDLLKINTKKVSDQAMEIASVFGKSADFDQQVRANSIIKEFNRLTVDENYSPEQAYEEVINRLTKTELPELIDLPQPRSVKIMDFKEQLRNDPKGTFETMRKDVAINFKTTKNISQYKEDMKRIDRLEDVLGVRLSVFDKDLDGALGKKLKKDK